MIAAGSLEYALARMQARLGRRVPESSWRSIEQSRDVAPILELCRGTSLQDVAAKLSASSDLHAVDAAIREGWRRAAAEAIQWMPAELAPALAWLRTLPLRPEVEHLARGGEASAWMRAEPDLADASTAPTAEAWYAEWERRLPPAALRDTALAGLARDVDRHLARFRAAPVHEAVPLRRDLEARFVACFRRHPLEPAAAFAWLGLCALDLERLRGELARRLAFPRARLVA